MKRKNILILSLCLLLSIIVVLTLYALSSKNIENKYSSFDRLILPNAIKGSKVLDIKYNSYYIAGGSTSTIYLGNATGAFHLLVTNTVLSDTQHITLKIDGAYKLKFRSIFVKVDSPNFYMADGVLPGIFSGRIGEWNAKRFKYDSSYFNQFIPLSSSSFALRVLSSITNDYVLAKETASTPHIRQAPHLLERQIDGMFCTDGMFNFQKNPAKLVYVYYYRNQYISIDTNLNLISKGNTIDTVSKVKIKIAKIQSENTITMAAPPLLVNKRSCVFGDLLFINSNLKARNESEHLFNQSSVIDVYDLKNNKYQYSFYVPHFNEMKMNDFKVQGNKLAALYENYLMVYNLDESLFSHRIPNKNELTL